jgi:hypothetical protein
MPEGLLVTSWYRFMYIAIFCGPKWYWWRSHRIFSTTSTLVAVGE